MDHSASTKTIEISNRKVSRRVSNLSTSQIHRKRVSDRNAQRVKRARTKDHIQHLQEEIARLKAQDLAIQELQRRNLALEDELTRLKHNKPPRLPSDIAFSSSVLGITAASAASTLQEGLQSYNHGFNFEQQYTPLPTEWDERCENEGGNVN
ncbi:hypothetical protein FPOAC1_007257 [Fusarium poae]|uniref:hypothetical protein n=1 Tax=Fusarium poae TaxID=36050 RepID=UPI001CE925B8|nr:hypothetical protein FPOAC1_007257 [Fusarium poae]KAG8673938.1 hypothetical protein FPOAC1_007257 [Fusarium poae]